MRYPTLGISLTVIAVVATTTLAPAFASAEHRTIDVELDSLSVEVDDGMVIVDYRLGSEGYRTARRHGAGLGLRMRGLYATRHRQSSQQTQWHRATFSSRRGTVRIPWSRASQLPKRLQVRLVASAPHTHVRHIHYRGQRRAGLHLHRHDDHHYRSPRSDDWAEDVDLEEGLPEAIVTACDNHAHGARRLDECLQTIAFTMPNSQAVDALEACGEATTSSKDFLACIERATLFHDNPAASVRACSEATDFSNYFEDCMHWASRISHAADRVVETCRERQSSIDKKVAGCVRKASRIGPQAAARVDACDASEETRGGFERCLRKIAD
jgi:hypothetical protein